MIANSVQGAMEKYVLFIQDTGKFFYLESDSGKLITLSPKSTDLVVLLSKDYGLNPVEPVSKFVLAQIRSHASSNSKSILLKFFTTYDEPSNTLYLQTGGNGIL